MALQQIQQVSTKQTKLIRCTHAHTDAQIHTSAHAPKELLFSNSKIEAVFASMFHVIKSS